MHCTNCGKETKKTICEHCGVKKNKTHFYCGWCGESLNEKASICTNCKERVTPTFLSRLGTIISVISCVVAVFVAIDGLIQYPAALRKTPITILIAAVLFFLMSKGVMRKLTHKKKSLHKFRGVFNVLLYILAFVIFIVGCSMARGEIEAFIVSHIIP